MVPLYADLVSEVTQGEVQLCAKEDYFPGEPAWPRNHASTSLLVRAYRRLSKVDRSHFAVMLKIGTYDDTFASHYLLLDPSHPGDPDDDDVAVPDPAMPEGKKLPWHLGKSAKCLCEDPDIKEAWKKANIEPLQIGGVWLFARWRTRNDPLLLGPMVEILASEMKSKR